MQVSIFRKAAASTAVLILLQACSSDPHTRELKYLGDGEKYFKAGKYQEAVIEFRNAIEIDARSPSAHYQLGKSYLALRNRDQAFRELNEAATLDPANSQVQLDVAALLLDRGQMGQAESSVRKVLSTDPGNLRAHAILAEKYTLAHEFPKAILEFQKLVELDPGNVANYAGLGAAYGAVGNSSAAENSYKRGVGANSKSASAHMALSQFYFSKGKMAEAELEMRIACNLDPHAIPPRMLLARIYLAKGRISDAEDVYASLKAQFPGDPEGYQALGVFYASSGRKEKATEEFKSLLQAHPNDNSTRAYLAELLLDLNRIAEATPLVQEVLRENPADPRGLVAQGRISIAHGNYQNATEVLQKASKAAPKSAEVYYLLGVAQHSVNLLDMARVSFQRALELDPKMASAAAALAGLAARNGDYGEAAMLADKARATAPDLSSANIATARTLLAKGDLRQTDATLQEILKQNPTSLSALTIMLSAYARQGRGAEGVQRLSNLVQQYPQNPGLRLLLGLAYFNVKDWAQSQTNAEYALKLDPKTPDAHTLLANIAFATGSVEGGKSHLRQAIALFPSGLLNYMILVTQYEKEENWQEATRVCQKAHEIAPDAPLVSAELAFLYLEHGGDLNTAVSLAQIARQKMPASPITADALGWAYYKLGSIGPAIEQLKQASEKAPDNPIYRYHLGMSYIAARQLALAGQSLHSALRTDPHFPYAANAQAALEQISKEVH